MKHDNKMFEVKLGVSNFQPEEIEVKVNEQDRMLVINAKHEEKRDDHGFISRQFSRQIYIPEVSLVAFLNKRFLDNYKLKQQFIHYLERLVVICIYCAYF